MPALFPIVSGYEFLAELGRGGMGVVYKARQTRLDRLVAVKILPSEAGRDPSFAERFAREARALAKLNHPNIITIYDFGQEGGQTYFVMEFVEGENLRRRLRAGPLHPEEVFALVGKICEALQYAHEMGIVHRDIKPENLLLDRRGQVKIADFGIAKLLTGPRADYTLTGPMQFVGTWNYMAPEQLENPLGLDHRADVYSLGVVFYEMLTGERPMGRFDPPSQKAPVPAEVDAVVLKALASDPAKRFQQAAEMKAALEAAGVPSRPKLQSIREAQPERRDQFEHDTGTLPIEPQGLPVNRKIIQERLRPLALCLQFIGILGCLFPLNFFFTLHFDWFALIWSALSIIQGILILHGAKKMATLKSYSWSIASCIIAMLPPYPFIVFGLPLGIWALVLLSGSEVRGAFSKQAALEPASVPQDLKLQESQASRSLLGSFSWNAGRFLGSATGWIIVCCVLGILACLQPWIPWAVIRIRGIYGYSTLVSAYGFEGRFGWGPAVAFLFLIILLLAFGASRPKSLWQPLTVIVIAIAVLWGLAHTAAWSGFLHPDWMTRQGKQGPGETRVEGQFRGRFFSDAHLLGSFFGDGDIHVSAVATVATGSLIQADYQGFGAKAKVGIDSGMAAPTANEVWRAASSALETKIGAAMYFVAFLSLCLVLLGAFQVRILARAFMVHSGVAAS